MVPTHADNIRCRSAFQSLPPRELPPQRRITQDEAASMLPLPAANSMAQAPISQEEQGAWLALRVSVEVPLVVGIRGRRPGWLDWKDTVVVLLSIILLSNVGP
ncbi:hypothetical protein BKA93DRAFT_542913 [Sparassis latifolia]